MAFTFLSSSSDILFFTSLSRKKQSVDLSAKSKSPDSQTSPQLPSTIPTVVISGDNDDDPASRAGSPIRRSSIPAVYDISS